MADVPLLVVSENASSERRITPSWTLAQLRGRLEPITGIPASAQRLTLTSPTGTKTSLVAADEDSVHLASFPLVPYAELHVADTRPAGARPNYTDTSGVDKYVMPEAEYEKKTDSVLAWKRAEKLGRFDPAAPSAEQARIAAAQHEITSRGIAVGRRCRVGGDDTRRGEVAYVGDVPEIPGVLGAWVGVRLDEPVGKNDGSIGGTRYWGKPSEDGETRPKHGVFVRPERVEVGDWPVLNDLEDMEEI